MAKMVYEWGSRSFPVNAQIVGEAIERIARKDGRCKPEQLVSVASDEQSPLHPLFTWDNDEAANKWRTHEARNIIGSVTITVSVNGDDTPAPAFISVGHVAATKHAGEGYRPISVVTSDEAFKQEAMGEALMRLRALRRRYEAIDALSPLWKVLEELEAA